MGTRTSRVMVNQPQSASNSGNLWNGMRQTFSLGCGSWGGNSINHNITWRDLINETWVSKPLATPKQIASDEESFGWCHGPHEIAATSGADLLRQGALCPWVGALCPWVGAIACSQRAGQIAIGAGRVGIAPTAGVRGARMADADFRHIRLTAADGVVTLTFDRPEVRNALNQRMMEEIGVAVDRLGGTADAQVVVLRGAGGHFCAGGDLNTMRDPPLPGSTGTTPNSPGIGCSATYWRG